ncbi:MAG: hypothetical protein ACYDIC_19355 [Desulfobaccales bacterium]
MKKLNLFDIISLLSLISTMIIIVFFFLYNHSKIDQFIIKGICYSPVNSVRATQLSKNYPSKEELTKQKQLLEKYDKLHHGFGFEERNLREKIRKEYNQYCESDFKSRSKESKIDNENKKMSAYSTKIDDHDKQLEKINYVLDITDGGICIIYKIQTIMSLAPRK